MLDGDAGLAAATMRSHNALLRVVEVAYAWDEILENSSGPTAAFSCGKITQLMECRKQIRDAINNSSPNAKVTNPDPTKL